jgi:hypothetical protein
MNPSLLALFSFPALPEELLHNPTGLTIRLFYEEESGCLSFKTKGMSVKIVGITFVPEATDHLIGYSFLTRGRDCGTYHQEIFCNHTVVPHWTLVFSKGIGSYSLKVYAQSYHALMVNDQPKPVFEWEGAEWEYMMALKGFMETWPYEYAGKMSIA